MNLFIDTNIFLSFYHLSSDDLEELKKLSVLLTEKKVTLHLPDQVKDEFCRNRELKISDAIKGLNNQKLTLQYPQFCKDYVEYSKLRDLEKEFIQNHSVLLEKIKKDIDTNNLKADELINSLFLRSNAIDTTDVLVSKARLRIEIGNPPGKKGSLGDAINWESLLEKVNNGEDINFVTDDKDYISSFNDYEFNEYLRKEWGKIKNSRVIFYKRLSSFFKENYPDIQLASVLEKELLIKSLVTSCNFANTHSIISKLNKYAEFTDAQLNDIVEAVILNSQIYSIIVDDDVMGFIKNIVKGNEHKVNSDNLNKLQVKIGEAEEYLANEQ